MKIENLAKIVHSANKAYCEALGDFSHMPWETSPIAIKASVIEGVRKVLANPKVTPEQSHKNWVTFKKEQGYRYGEVKNDSQLTHPCMLPWKDLPAEQKIKDQMFIDLVLLISDEFKIEDDTNDNQD